MKTLKLLTLIFLLTLISACSDDDDSGQTLEDIQQQIENFVSPEVLETLEELGFVFREGVDTPDISGTFIHSPNVLSGTNLENDPFEIGDRFANFTHSFSNINNETRTFMIEATQSGTSFEPIIDTFFTGSENGFNAYIQTQFVIQEETAILILAISGVITPEGITSAQSGVFVLDSTDEGPDSVFIAPGEGRLFEDEDGLAERQTEDTSSNINNESNILFDKYSLSSILKK